MSSQSIIKESWHGKVFPIALLISAAFLIVYVVFGYFGFVTALEPGAVIGEAHRWCESVSDSMFREPVNTLSNLGFMATGLYMFWVLSKDTESKNQFHGFTPIAMLYAGCAIYLGPGSMLMHGTHTYWGGWADNLSMVMYIILPWLINVSEMGRWSLKKFFIVYLSIVSIDGVGRWFLGSDMGIGFELFGVSIGLWIVSEFLYRFYSQKVRWLSGFIGFVVAAIFGIFPTEIIAEFDKYWWVLLFWVPAILSPNPPRYRRANYYWFYAGMACYLLAFTVWLRGVPDSPYCYPDSLIQAHGIWHLLCAAATLCFFKFLRTEKVLN